MLRAPQSQLLGSRVGSGWEGDPHFQKDILGVIRENPGGEDWKVASFLSALRGRGLSEGLGRCESELKSSPRILQGPFQPSADTDPRQDPGQGGQDSACSASPRIRCILS